MPRREGYRRFRGAWQPSEAQRRVLDALAAGRTNTEIAVRLGLSAGTVKWHVAQLLAEAGCADREALARWWIVRRGRGRGLVPLLGIAAGTATAVAVVCLAVMLLGMATAVHERTEQTVAPSAQGRLPSPVVSEAGTTTSGLVRAGPFIVRGAGPIRAENRAAASAVDLIVGDLIRVPAGMYWGSPPGVAVTPLYGLAATATPAGQPLYVWLQTGGGDARFERLDDRTFRVVAAGTVLIWAHDAENADHAVAVDAAGHLLLDPAPVAGDIVALYGSGERLDLQGRAPAGRLAPVRRVSYPTEWYFTLCEGGVCALSYRAGPLVAPVTGVIVCEQGVEFDLDAGAFRLRFRNAGTLRDNPTWTGPEPADCGPERTVRAGEIITEAYVHYIVTAVSAVGEPWSVAVAYDGTLYVGPFAAAMRCPPCRGS